MSKPGSLIICIDFDGTIVDHAFPEIGHPLPGAFEVMKELQEAGHRLVLHTCRTNHEHADRKHLNEAVEFCRQHGVEFRSINENHVDDRFQPDWPSIKPYAHVYIDDRNLGGFPGWAIVRCALLHDHFGNCQRPECPAFSWPRV